MLTRLHAKLRLPDVTVRVDRADLERFLTEGKAARRPTSIGHIADSISTHHRFTRDCNSWKCPEHAPTKAEVQLTRARTEFSRYPVTWFAEVPYDNRVVHCLRFRRRPERGGGGTVLVRRANGRLLCFATRAMPGAPWPHRWFPLAPEVATARFAAGLALPGVVRVQWSPQGWTTTG